MLTNFTTGRWDSLIARAPVNNIGIDAIVIRANGYREDLGRIASWDRSLLKRFAYRFKRSRDGRLFVATDPMIGIISLLGPAFLATFMTDVGEAIVTNRLLAGGTEPKNIGWGTSAGTTARTDTTLFGEKLVDLSTSAGTDHTVGASSQVTTTDTNDTYQVTGTRTATGAGTVTNAGLFDAASGGTLFMKGDFTGIGLAIADSIAFTCKVQFTN
jgi:hypothetical protein